MDQVSELADDSSNPLDASETDEAAAIVSDPNERLDRIVESVLFAAGAPISVRKLIEILDGPSAKDVHAALERLKVTYGPGQRGIQLHEVAGGFQFRTARENAEWVRSLFKEKPTRLGRATLETLAVIAYRQPVTKAEIELIRGVDVEGTLATLLARKLIKITGRKEAVGRPLLYATSTDFLEIFGLKDLNELPSLKELGPGPDAEYSETSTADAEGGEISTADGEAGETATPASAETLPTTAAAAASDADGDGVDDAAPAEDPESVGDHLEAQGGGADPGGADQGERPSGSRAGDEGEPEDGPDHD